MSEKPQATGEPRLDFSFESRIPVEEMVQASERDIKEAVQQIHQEVEQSFERYAQASFSEDTAAKYLAGLRVRATSNGVEADIEGWLPTALEEGFPRFDMKPGLLAGRQRRVIRLHNGNFRTVSKKSPETSWWHPGLQARNIAEQVREEVEPMAEQLFASIRGRVQV